MSDEDIIEAHGGTIPEEERDQVLRDFNNALDLNMELSCGYVKKQCREKFGPEKERRGRPKGKTRKRSPATRCSQRRNKEKKRKIKYLNRLMQIPRNKIKDFWLTLLRNTQTIRSLDDLRVSNMTDADRDILKKCQFDKSTDPDHTLVRARQILKDHQLPPRVQEAVKSTELDSLQFSRSSLLLITQRFVDYAVEHLAWCVNDLSKDNTEVCSYVQYNACLSLPYHSALFSCNNTQCKREWKYCMVCVRVMRKMGSKGLFCDGRCTTCGNPIDVKNPVFEPDLSCYNS